MRTPEPAVAYIHTTFFRVRVTLLYRWLHCLPSATEKKTHGVLVDDSESLVAIFNFPQRIPASHSLGRSVALMSIPEVCYEKLGVSCFPITSTEGRNSTGFLEILEPCMESMYKLKHLQSPDFKYIWFNEL